MSHTPGPWAFKEGNAERASMSEVFKEADKEFRIGFVTCENRSQQQRAEDIANARLIAAAPELLQSLRECLDIVRIQNGNLHDDINELQKRAQAAIAKATT